MPAVSARPLPGDVEGRAVGHAGANDRQAERHVHRAVHGQELDRDVPLIVVHGHHGVELAVAGTDQSACRPAGGPRRRCPRGGPARRPARSMICSSSPNRPSSPACGLSAQTPICRRRAFELAHDAGHEPRLADDGLLVDRGENLGQGHVQRDVHHGQARRAAHDAAGTEIEHHGKVVDAAQLGQQLGMARIVMAGLPQRGLVQGRGDQGIDAAVDRQPGSGDQRVVGCLSTSRVDRRPAARAWLRRCRRAGTRSPARPRVPSALLRVHRFR